MFTFSRFSIIRNRGSIGGGIFLINPSTIFSSSQPASTSMPSAQISRGNLQILRREDERRERVMRISDSMKFYLKSLQTNEELLEERREEYELGKRHLANIMGFDVETLTQEQIDASIRYLFPSGLFKLTARPQMKPPDISHVPDQLELDESGRPKHTLFYTKHPKFYTLLTNINKRTRALVREYDRRQLAHSRGEMSKEEATQGHPLSTALLKEWKYTCDGETIYEDMKAAIAVALEYMAQLPNASLEAEFFANFGLMDSQAIATDDNNQGYNEYKGPILFKGNLPMVHNKLDGFGMMTKMATAFSIVKRTKMKATVCAPGTGKFTVNGEHYDVFRDVQAREILLSPMIVCGLLGQVDIQARLLRGPGGKSVVPRAVRHATALCLAALFPEWGERLRVAGMLDADLRRRERSKINQPGARAKWIWKRR